ncbi:hypothetical protein BH11BAC3_BH11BAC3_12660 [soil metagenome]
MKVFSYFICSIVTICMLFGCKKDSCESPIASGLIGKWELRKVEGSITTNYPSGNGSTYQFTDTAYSIFSNGVLVKKGRYKVISDASVSSEVGLVFTSGEYANRIIFDDDILSNKIFFQITETKLSFVSGYFPLDGGSFRTYEKE